MKQQTFITVIRVFIHEYINMNEDLHNLGPELHNLGPELQIAYNLILIFFCEYFDFDCLKVV